MDTRAAVRFPGHRADNDVKKLPLAFVRAAVSSKRLTLEELADKALVLHEGGDNFSGPPRPLGGGGKRIACGLIEAGAEAR